METKEDLAVKALPTNNQVKVAGHQDENSENTILEMDRVAIDGENSIVLESAELMEEIPLMSTQHDQIIKEFKAENKESLDNPEYNNSILEMETLKTEIGEDNNNVKIIGLQTHEPLAEHDELHYRNNDSTCDSYDSGMAPVMKFNPFLLDDEKIPGKNWEQFENVSKIYENISDMGLSSNHDSGQAFAHAVISNGVENWHRFDEDNVAERNIYEDCLLPPYVEANGSIAMLDNKHEPELWEKLLDDHSLNHENGEREIQDFEWLGVLPSPGNPFFGRLGSFSEPDAIGSFEFNGNPMQGLTSDPKYTRQTDVGANLKRNGASSSEERTNPWISFLEMEDLREVETESQHTQTPTDLFLSREGKAFERECKVKGTTLPSDAHLQSGQKLKYFFHDFVSPWQSPTPSPPRLTSSLSSPEERESAKRKSFSSLSELRRSWTWTSPKLRRKVLAGLSPWPTKKMVSARGKKVSSSPSASNSIIKVVQKKLHGDNVDCMQKHGSSESREGIEHKPRIDEDPMKTVDENGESRLSFHQSFSEEILSKAMREDLVSASMGKYYEHNFSKGLDSSVEPEVGKIGDGKERFEISTGSTFWDPFMSPRQSAPSSLTGVTSSPSSPASPNRASIFISPSGSQSQSASPMPESKASVNLQLRSGSNKNVTSSRGKKKTIASSPPASPFIKKILRKARSGPVVSASNFVDLDTREVKAKHASLWTMCFCRPSTK